MAAHKAPPSLGFSRQEHWSGLPFPSPVRCYALLFHQNWSCHGIYSPHITKSKDQFSVMTLLDILPFATLITLFEKTFCISLLRHHTFLIFVLSCAQSLSCVWLFGTPWTIAHQALLSTGIFQVRILEWVAISYSGGLPDPGIECTSPRWRVGSLPLCHLGAWLLS